jgi:hypothetical protein
MLCEAIVDSPMSCDRAEIALRAFNFKRFDNLIAQLCDLYPEAEVFQGSDQPTQYRPRCNIDGRHIRKIEDNSPDRRRGAIDHIEDLPADVIVRAI